ncbi:hypothetical protein RUM43_007193 [Polyplax serrata]|uniref:CAF17 C-terminal domain-containing protein n=1 Tax=Polyplax serrata TaxID=468196 RepID=A0AAN8Q5S3_POLSC
MNTLVTAAFQKTTWTVIRNCSHYNKTLKRSFSVTDKFLLAQNLGERTVLKLKGNDCHLYLQGLITNDIGHLQGGSSSIFAMFLNNKGRVLCDTIVYNSGIENTFFIECDHNAALQLSEHLMRYKVRRKITIENVGEELTIWALANNNCLNQCDEDCDYKKIGNLIKEKVPHIITTGDPRLRNMGLRIIVPRNLNICNEMEKLTGLKVEEGNFYKLLRYKLGIAEGNKELPPEKCFPMEINGDYMHGISFHKGCYIGQELTARTHYTGVIRKRVMPITFTEKTEACEHGTPIFSAEQTNKAIGKLFGIEGKNGLALLRIEDALSAPELLVSSSKCKTHHPFWWPIEAPKMKMNPG